jgi:peptidoglycan/xylan/chitin deacetylase (PgdA/CDA1 family)
MRIFIVGVVTLLAVSAHAATVVTLSFDDTFDDQMQAGQLLASAGLHGTFYVNSARLGQPSYLTLDQVIALQAAGNEIGGHTVDHLSLGIVPAEEEQRQICDDRAAMLGMGLQITSLAYPHGSAPTSTQSIASTCGYNSARDSSGLRSHDPEGCINCAFAETMPPLNAFAVRTPHSLASNMTAADLEQNVTEAEANGGGWVPFVMHHVCDGCNDDAISPEVLQEFLTWVAARQAMGTTVKTVNQVIGGAVNPAVNGPAPMPFIATDGNLLRNGDFEVDSDPTGLPDCIESLTGGANSNDYTVGLAPAAHSGTYAAQIEFIPGKSGNPLLVSLQDLGYCSPPAKTGDQFVFSFYYQSTDPVAPSAYYRTATGWWKTLAQGPTLSAAAAWTMSEWTLPTIPPDAVAVSVGVGILTTGTLAVDDFMLVNLNAPAVTPDGGTIGSDGGTTPANDAGVPIGDGGTSSPDGAAHGDLGSESDQGGCTMASTQTDVAPFAFFALVAVCFVCGRFKASRR